MIISVCCTSIADGVHLLAGAAVVATCTGSPTLDEWGDEAADTEQVAVTRALVEGVYQDANGINADDDGLVVVVYAGGYGGDDYTASLAVLCGAAIALADESFIFVFR